MRRPGRAAVAEYGKSVRDYAVAVSRHGWVLVVSGVGGVAGLVSLAYPFVIPTAVFVGVGVVGFVLAQFLAFHDVRSAARRQADRRAELAQLFATELQAIRRKIEVVMSIKPHPTYSDGFALPAYRWDEYDDELSAWPDLYEVVERAYTAVDHFNSALDLRRTRAGGTTLGMTPDEEIDTVYERAGSALNALGREPAQPWESHVDRAARELIEEDAA